MREGFLSAPSGLRGETQNFSLLQYKYSFSHSDLILLCSGKKEESWKNDVKTLDGPTVCEQCENVNKQEGSFICGLVVYIACLCQPFLNLS